MMKRRLLQTIVASVALWSCGPLVCAQTDTVQDPVEALLARIVPEANKRAPDALLLGLRRLRDPALRPLFGGLADSRRADLRAHGLLGLAELNAPPRLNLLSVSRLENREERARLLGEGIRLHLVESEALGEVLNWRGLDPYLEIVVRGRLLGQGEDPGLERVRELAAGSGDPLSQAMALLLLAQAGEAGRAAEAATRIASIEGGPNVRDAGVAIMLEHTRREKLTGAGPFCAQLYELYEPTDQLLSLDVLSVWLRIAPAESREVWSQRVEGATDLGAQLRLALVGLDAASGLDPELFSPFVGDDSGEALVADLMRLAQSIAQRDEEAVIDAAERVLEHQYPRAMQWCASRAPEVMPEIGPTLWSMMIRKAGARRRPGPGVSKTLPLVAESLAAKDPEALAGALSDARASRDDDLCQALLMGALAARSGLLWDPTGDVDWPDPASRSLALLVQARAAETMDQEAIDQLRAVARGRGNLPELFRVQAAWLSIKHAGTARQTLARLLTLPGIGS